MAEEIYIHFVHFSPPRIGTIAVVNAVWHRKGEKAIHRRILVDNFEIDYKSVLNWPLAVIEKLQQVVQAAREFYAA